MCVVEKSNEGDVILTSYPVCVCVTGRLPVTCAESREYAFLSSARRQSNYRSRCAESHESAFLSLFHDSTRDQPTSAESPSTETINCQFHRQNTERVQ